MQVSGYVTEIERYSIHDGPGIRSVVFLKGCQLRCGWCANPETIARVPEMSFVRAECICCFNCVEDCPYGAITVTEDRNVETNREVCAERCYGTTDIYECTRQCYSGARKTIGRRMTVEQVLAEVEKDHQIYERTGGGVTLSGGEVSHQPEFTTTLLKAMKESWIDTAVETNGGGPKGFLDRVIPYVDFFFLDIKSLDAEKHRRWTGASNESSLEAARQLTKHAQVDDCSLVIRTPIIPGFNDTPGDLKGIGTFIRDTLQNIPQWELLPFHRLGRGKYTSIGRMYAWDGVEPLSPAGLEELEAVARDLGVRMVRY